MFPYSTQKKFWMFFDENEINRLREKANTTFILKHGQNLPEKQRQEFFLTAAEERLLVRKYELHLREFCKRFSPPMPQCVLGTAFHYFKRFYIKNSVMDYHPKEIMVTCVYLAAKVEEFNVSIAQFVANVKGDREKASDIIINNELLLMEQLDFHLSIHNPYRPVEGLLIDIKTRGSMNSPERLRPGIDDFLEKVFLTDACLIYAPSQIALAAILHAASKVQENLDSYVTETLFGEDGQKRLADLIEAVRKIRSLVKAVEPLPKEPLRYLDKKLDKCRNQENNPDSEIYKQRMAQMSDDEEESYHTLAKNRDGMDDSVLGMVHSDME
ncbi:cyclin-H [Chrysoperla carnea]|uniref:cyclin-H n=1 Tax=Chrysoperla carnea TaxID=189513 RepID=UPI001D0711AE|nr:cyclin-H [Chrysoperla carnea]